MKRLMRFLLAGLALFSGVAFANYYVPPSSYTAPNVSSYPTATAALDATIAEWKGRYSKSVHCTEFNIGTGSNGLPYVEFGGCAVGGRGVSANCPFGTVWDSSELACRISQCPEGTEPNSENHCVQPAECEAGNEALRISYAFLSDSPNPPSSICTAGCVHGYKGILGVGISEPTVPGLFKYWVKYESTETACEGETPQEDPPPAPDPDPSEPGDGGGSGDPDPETPNHCPPGYSPGPNTDTCFKNPDPDGGDGDGGDGGTGGGDGGTGGNGGTGGGDGGTGGGDGGTGGGDGGTGGGTGDGGTGGGTGDGGTGGGTGDGGTGGGTGDGDGEGEGEGKYSGGADCETAPDCSGDAIQCGIVDQQWRMRCDFEKAYDYEAHKGDIEGLLEGDEFKMIEGAEAIEVPSFLNMHARWLGSSSCPPDETMTLRLGGGRTFALSYEPLCQAATSISPLLVIIATVLATLYIGRGLEG